MTRTRQIQDSCANRVKRKNLIYNCTLPFFSQQSLTQSKYLPAYFSATIVRWSRRMKLANTNLSNRRKRNKLRLIEPARKTNNGSVEFSFFVLGATTPKQQTRISLRLRTMDNDALSNAYVTCHQTDDGTNGRHCYGFCLSVFTGLCKSLDVYKYPCVGMMHP